MDNDDFYDKLPYTLNEDQLSPDFVIFGTGLQECVLAAYLSKALEKKGLVIDTDKTYGSSLKTVTLKELHQLTSLKTQEKMYDFTCEMRRQKNQQYFDWCMQNKKFRGFSIDIEPNFFFASSVTCESLKDADMDKYMDFHLVDNIIHIHENTFRPVPLSKGKIFASPELSMLEKKNLMTALHKLIKIYHKYMNLEQDVNSTKQFDKGFGQIQQSLYNEFISSLDGYFLPFINKMVKQSKKILNYLTYIICNYQYNYNSPIPEYAKEIYTLKGFIMKFGKFIKSCGIYGESPYLYVDNGIGDIPQAFSRIASIYGSTYILHPKVTIDSIEKIDDKYLISTNLSPQKPILTKQIYFGPTHLSLSKSQQEFYQQKILRVLLICQKNGKQTKCPAICFIPELEPFKNPIYLFLFDESTQSCPKNIILYQFQTILPDDDDTSKEGCEQKAEKLINQLKNIYGPVFQSTIKYSTVYLRTRRYPKQQKINETALSLHDTMGIDLDQHFNNFVRVVGKKESYFKKATNEAEVDDEPLGGYETNYLLEQLQLIDLSDKKEEEGLVNQQSSPGVVQQQQTLKVVVDEKMKEQAIVQKTTVEEQKVEPVCPNQSEPIGNKQLDKQS